MINGIFGKNKRRTHYLPMTIMLLLSLLLSSGITFAQDEAPEVTPEPADFFPDAPLPGESPLTGEASHLYISAVTVPTPKSPSGTIYLTKPTYKWTMISSATKYQFQLYRGTTKLLNAYLSSSICGSTTCSFKPDKLLSEGDYKWHVRAYVNGSWKSWSVYKTFKVIKGFNSQFNGSYANWIKNPGATWKIYSGQYYGTPGTTNLFSTTRHKNIYKDFDFSSRVRRVAGTVYFPDCDCYVAPFNDMYIRMGKSFTSWANIWYPGYVFGYSNWFAGDNGGQWYIFRLTSTGEQEPIDGGWTTSIKSTGWNTLRVVAKGTTYKFYINGVLVDTLTSSFRSNGYVGFGMTRLSSASTYFYVDWAKLTPITATTASISTTDEADLARQELEQADFEQKWEVECDPLLGGCLLKEK